VLVSSTKDHAVGDKEMARFCFLALFCLVIVLRSIAPTSAYAVEPKQQILRECAQGATECELNLFKDLSRVFRAIGEEENVIEYLNSILIWANANVWTGESQLQATVEEIHLPKPIPSINPNKPGGITTKIKNYLVRVPATGPFALRSNPAPSVALQSHMDMVTKSSDSTISLYDQFKNGVEIEEDPSRPGWLQSKGRKTTLGCDNGCGMALAIRYMLDKTKAHPEMELFFTAAEENGLQGATYHDPQKITIQSRVMLGLDGANTDSGRLPEGVIIIGSLGASRWINSGDIQNANLADLGGNLKIVQVRFTDFPGGHSGLTIHEPRLNSALHGASVVAAAVAEAPSELHGVVSAVAPEVDINDPKAISSAKGQLNVIPSTFLLNLAVTSNFNLDRFKTKAESELNALSLKYPIKLKKVINGVAQEVPPKVSVNEIALNPSWTKFVVRSEAQRVLAAMAQAPNGVIVPNANLPQGSNGWQLSSNTGYFFLGVKPGDTLQRPVVESGFMARGFIDTDFQLSAKNCVVDKATSGPLGAVLDALATLTSNIPVAQCELVAGYSPWYEDPNKSRLVQLALKSKIFTTPVVFAAGLETSYWKMKYPGIEMVEIGVDSTGAHETAETFRADSLRDISSKILLFINEISK